MKKTMLTLSALGCLLIMGAHQAHAQYMGPSTAKLSTVAEVLANAKHNTYVQLEGRIIRKIEWGEYIFADETAEIKVEIEEEAFTVPVDENTLVTITGEFENFPLFPPEIDVETLVVSTPQ
jgi:uncharacterized protein (TIGR00156 family)